MSKSCILYTRVSTDEQAERGYSLQHQSIECRRYAMLNGFTIHQEFSDDFSGATLERPGFSDLREFIAQNHVDAVIVYTADRLSRNVIDFLVLRDQWEKAGIELHFVDRGRSHNNFEGLLTDGIFALIAHGERLQIIERTMNGRHRKAKANHIVMAGTTPYGYLKKGLGKDAEYVIHPYEAQVVQNMFEWYVNGYENRGPLSLRALADLLDEMGISPPKRRTKKAASFWHPGVVGKILKNPIYIGITYYGRLKNENGKRVRRPKEEWTTIEVPHLALVNPELFELAQKRAQRNIELAKRNRKHPYLMVGRFRCGTCGYAMIGHYKKISKNVRRSYYRCSATFHKKADCQSRKKQIAVRRVDAAVWDWLTALLEDENNLAEGIRAMIEQKARDFGPMQERLNTIESLLFEADVRIERLIDELSQYEGYAVRDVIREKVKAIESEKNMLSEEAGRLVTELEQNNISPDFEDQIRRTTAIIREKLSGATYEDKCRILEILDVRANYYFEEKLGEILEISCMIPLGESVIVLSPSPRWWRARCSSSPTTGTMPI